MVTRQYDNALDFDSKDLPATVPYVGWREEKRRVEDERGSRGKGEESVTPGVFRGAAGWTTGGDRSAIIVIPFGLCDIDDLHCWPDTADDRQRASATGATCIPVVP